MVNSHNFMPGKTKDFDDNFVNSHNRAWNEQLVQDHNLVNWYNFAAGNNMGSEVATTSTATISSLGMTFQQSHSPALKVAMFSCSSILLVILRKVKLFLVENVL